MAVSMTLDDAVAGCEVCQGDGGVIDHHLALDDLDDDRLAQDGIGGHDLAAAFFNERLARARLPYTRPSL